MKLTRSRLKNILWREQVKNKDTDTQLNPKFRFPLYNRVIHTCVLVSMCWLVVCWEPV